VIVGNQNAQAIHNVAPWLHLDTCGMQLDTVRNGPKTTYYL